MNKPIILLFLSLIFGCSDSDYEGYTKLSSELHYQRLALGEGLSYHPDSCFLDYTVNFSPLYDGAKSELKEIKFAQLSEEILKDSLLTNCKAGDRIRFITSNSKDYLYDLCKIEGTFDSSLYLVEVYIDQVYNLFIQEEDHNVLEYKEIDEFLNFNSYTQAYTYYSGIWIKKIEPSEDSNKLKGEIILDYKGYSLKGDEWDIPDFPLKFNIKDQYQVIRGIELALSTMHFQDSADVIIPSYLAFGEQGSKNGNIPPFKALRYHLKVYHPDSIDLKVFQE